MQRGFDHQYGHYSALRGLYDHSRGDKYYDWHRNEQTIYEAGYTSYLIADEFDRFGSKHAVFSVKIVYFAFI